jgi:hypothetical protein
MYGSDTFAIDVSSNSMKVASVTVRATTQGLIAARWAAGAGTTLVAKHLPHIKVCFNGFSKKETDSSFFANLLRL